MRHTNDNHLGWISLAALALAGCGAADAELTEQGVPLDAAELAPGPVPTLDEFVESTRQTRRIGEEVVEEYVLEGDMIASYEMVVQYYEAMYVTSDTVEKGVGVTVPSGGRLAPRLLKYNPAIFPVITYCFDAKFSINEKAAFVSAVATATAAWDSASGPLSFRYQSNLDGASCSTTSEPLLGFRVTKASSVSQGTLPGQANRFLALVSTDAATLLHEVGHIIGLGHEINHTKSILGCPRDVFPSTLPSGAAFKDLTTGWDPQSIMQHRGTNGLAACRHTTATTAILSSGDKVAARALYGT